MQYVQYVVENMYTFFGVYGRKRRRFREAELIIRARKAGNIIESRKSYVHTCKQGLGLFIEGLIEDTFVLEVIGKRDVEAAVPLHCSHDRLFGQWISAPASEIPRNSIQ